MQNPEQSPVAMTLPYSAKGLAVPTATKTTLLHTLLLFARK
jgi:hypothetical protein